MRYLLLVALIFLTGCPESDQVKKLNVIPPAAPQPTDEQAKHIKALEDRINKATLEHDEIARLTALNELLQVRTQVAEQGVVDLKRDNATVKEQLSDAKEKAWQESAATKLHIFASILGAAALLAGLIAVWQPQIAKKAIMFGIACAAIASLALAVAKLLPYLIYIGGGILVLGVIAYLVWNRLSDKTRHQITMAVDKYKHEIPDYKTKFAAVIDHDADRLIDATRDHLGLKNVESNLKSSEQKPG